MNIFFDVLYYRIYIVHDEVKDKAFELELSWVGELTNGRHEMVPKDIAEEANKYGKVRALCLSFDVYLVQNIVQCSKVKITILLMTETQLQITGPNSCFASQSHIAHDKA